ncbi:Bug family tripartite tricarboxylate transporter substrate binding protein [Schauerella aestuarii]|uniref:Bug family tripartite tricarboxylate transporter substrate binding protein n=1 Tax=Schauerella aestuarii TaxID=2511204 RepID=UPI00136B7C40|nr:tripartite tricarboxylate transporter substrate binding protein [Achromobacter aestuarii]MYZ43767.1 tripartite tricarboxylate transporter substrate binding protein [Achromobacter aestuarii]
MVFADRLRTGRHRARLAAGLLLAVLTGGFSATALAAWPDRPIHLVVPFPAGSSPDTLARAIAEPLSQSLGQPIVVENKPGAGGNIGTRFVARSEADGNTLLYTINGPLVTAPTLYKKTLGYDPFTDLAPISLVATSPNVLTVSGDMANIYTAGDLAKLATSRPGALNYGSVGPGSSAHLAMEMFKQQAKVDLAHIPYSGFPQVITAIISGDVQAGFMVPAIAMPQVRAGKARALAVTSLARSPLLPDLPTMVEQGYPGFESISWNAVLAPAGTPTPIIERLNSELARIITSEPLRKQMALQYFTPAASTPEALTRRMRDEKARYDTVIDTLKLSLD